jgi:hypothetical protein
MPPFSHLHPTSFRSTSLRFRSSTRFSPTPSQQHRALSPTFLCSDNTCLLLQLKTTISLQIRSALPPAFLILHPNSLSPPSAHNNPALPPNSFLLHQSFPFASTLNKYHSALSPAFLFFAFTFSTCPLPQLSPKIQLHFRPLLFNPFTPTDNHPALTPNFHHLHPTSPCPAFQTTQPALNRSLFNISHLESRCITAPHQPPRAVAHFSSTPPCFFSSSSTLNPFVLSE